MATKVGLSASPTYLFHDAGLDAEQETSHSRLHKSMAEFCFLLALSLAQGRTKHKSCLFLPQIQEVDRYTLSSKLEEVWE